MMVCSQLFGAGHHEDFPGQIYRQIYLIKLGEFFGDFSNLLIWSRCFRALLLLFFGGSYELAHLTRVIAVERLSKTLCQTLCLRIRYDHFQPRHTLHHPQVATTQVQATHEN